MSNTNPLLLGQLRILSTVFDIAAEKGWEITPQYARELKGDIERILGRVEKEMVREN